MVGEAVEWTSPRAITSHYDFVLQTLHLSCGIYLWEYVSTFDFEWDIYTRKRPSNWSGLMYIGSRFFGLAVCIVALVGFNAAHELDCTLWWKAVYVLGSISVELANVLLCLRVVALWQRQLKIGIIVGLLYATNITAVILGAYEAHSDWIEFFLGCIPNARKSLLPAACLFLASYIGLFSLMSIGLWRTRSSGCLWALANRQGLTWLLVAGLIITPGVVLLGMDLDDPMNLLFQTPCALSLVVCSTRMYRCMIKFCQNNTTEMSVPEGRAIESRIAFARNPGLDQSTLHPQGHATAGRVADVT